jgi:ATP-binding cassette subfamily F protein 3
MRIALATILVHQPDHILLDEPTNHLDRASQEWLAGELAEYPGTVLLVTHDGSFLDRVVTRIVEIDEAKVFSYAGTYTSHLKQKADRIELQNRAADRQAREIQKQEDYINRFRAAANRASQVQSREKAVAKIERVVKHRDSAKTKFTFVSHGRVEREVLKLTGISHAWEDDPVLLDLNLVVERGQKVALIGPNGGGKSTLLRIAAKQAKPSEGTVE